MNNSLSGSSISWIEIWHKIKKGQFDTSELRIEEMGA